MSERDPRFTEDVLKIVYAALADREALAAAMSEAQPLPVTESASAPTDPTPPPRPSPMDVGVQGGASANLPPAVKFGCARTTHLFPEDYAYDPATETLLGEIQNLTGATREEVVQEALRCVLSQQIAELRRAI